MAEAGDQRRDAVREAAARADWSAVREALGDSRAEVRRQALAELVEAGRPEALEQCVALLVDRARPVRRGAADALRQAKEQAVPLLAGALLLDDRRAWAAAVLACSVDGRRILRDLPDSGCAPLLEAAADDSLAISPYLVNVAKALVICPPAEVGDALARLFGRSPMLRYAAGRALFARCDPRGLPWVLEQLRWPPSDEKRGEAMLQYVAAIGDPVALPTLRKLTGPFGWLRAGGPVRQAARLAVARIEDELKHIPAAALSRAGKPLEAPTDAALSFWQEDADPPTEPTR